MIGTLKYAMLWVTWLGGIGIIHAQQPYEYFHENVYVSEIPLIPVFYQGRYGYINDNGDTAIPFIYREATPFSQGYAKVRVQSQYGYINTQGKMVVPMLYDKAERYYGGGFLVRTRGNYHLLDTNGQVLLIKQCDEAALDGVYLSLTWTKERAFNDKHALVLVSENRTFPGREIIYPLSPERYLVGTKTGYEIWDHLGNRLIVLKQLYQDLVVSEHNNYLLLATEKDINEDYEPTATLLYGPDGKLVKKITFPEGYVVDLYKRYNEDANLLFALKLRLKYNRVESHYQPTRYVGCDKNGNLSPIPTLQSDTIPVISHKYVLTQAPDNNYFIEYASGIKRKLPQGFAYFPEGNLIRFLEKGKSRGFGGLMDTSLNILLADSNLRFNSLPIFPQILQVQSSDSLWYINPAGKIFWRNAINIKKYYLLKDTVYRSIVDAWDINYSRNPILSDTQSDSVRKNLAEHISQKSIWVYVNASVADNGYFSIYLGHSSSQMVSVFPLPEIQVKNQNNRWVTLAAIPNRYRCAFSVPPNIELTQAQTAFLRLPAYQGSYATQMRVGFQTKSKPGKKIIYSNPFLVSINPDQLY